MTKSTVKRTNEKLVLYFVLTLMKEGKTFRFLPSSISATLKVYWQANVSDNR